MVFFLALGALFLPIATSFLQSEEGIAVLDIASHESSIGMQLFQVKAAVDKVTKGIPGPLDYSGNWWDYPEDNVFTSCQLFQILLPVACYLFLGLPLVELYFRRYSDSRDGERALKSALCMSVFAVFMENLVYSIIFVDSVDFASSISWTTIDSGTMVGIQKVGTATGTFIMFLIFLRDTEFWRTGGPSVYLIGFCIQTASVITFAILGLSHVFFGLDGQLILTTVNMARLVGGLGGGLQISFGLQQSAHLVTGSARSLQNTRWFLGGCVGMGLGPLLASSASVMANTVNCGESTPSYEITIALVAFLTLIQLPTFSKLRPVEDVVDVGITGYGVESDRPRQTVVVLICLAMQVLRAMSMAAVEAAATELLRTHYGWSRRITGSVTSLVIFTMVPVQAVYEKTGGYRQAGKSIRSLLVCAIAGSAFMLISTATNLLGGCVLLLPTMALSSGLIMGRMQAHSLPDGSVLDLNKITLFSLLLSDLIGRGFGPSMARRSVSTGGQASFARDQLLMAVSSLVLNEIAAFIAIPECKLEEVRKSGKSLEEETSLMAQDSAQDAIGAKST